MDTLRSSHVIQNVPGLFLISGRLSLQEKEGMQHSGTKHYLAQNGVRDVMSLILSHLDWQDILAVRSVCKDFKVVADETLTSIFPKHNLVVSIKEDCNELASRIPQTKFMTRVVLPKLRFHFEYVESILDKWSFSNDPIQRPFHLSIACSGEDAFNLNVPRVPLETLQRVEFVILHNYLVRQEDLYILQSVPHVECSSCCFEIDSINFTHSPVTQTFLMTNECVDAGKLTPCVLTPIKCMRVDLSIVEINSNDLVCGDQWQFDFTGFKRMSNGNKDFLKRITGKLHLSSLEANWTWANHLETLSCTQLCLRSDKLVIFPLASYDTVQELYASGICFMTVHYEQSVLPALHTLCIEDCFFHDYDLSLVFPKLEVLEIHHDETKMRCMTPYYRLADMQNLQSLTLHFYSRPVSVQNNPRLHHLVMDSRLHIVLADNPCLHEVYLEEVESSPVRVSGTDLQIHLVSGKQAKGPRAHMTDLSFDRHLID